MKIIYMTPNKKIASTKAVKSRILNKDICISPFYESGCLPCPKDRISWFFLQSQIKFFQYGKAAECGLNRLKPELT